MTPIIVTGCGRSGTHWLANVLSAVLGPEAAAHEPTDIADVSTVAVDSRLRWQADALAESGHRVLHLVRDGRDVVRSLYAWHLAHNPESFETCCAQWVEAMELMGNHPAIRLEDLTRAGDPTPIHAMPHWRDWDMGTAETFWRICGPSMVRLGYGDRGITFRELVAKVREQGATIRALQEQSQALQAQLATQVEGTP